MAFENISGSIRPKYFSRGAPIRSDCKTFVDQTKQKPEPTERPTRWPNSLVTLAIETSCDDTCVAILEKERQPPNQLESGNDVETVKSRLLFEERITADNRAFGGIHPLTAAISHTISLAQLVKKALGHLPRNESTSRASSTAPDFVSVTRGPGMQSSLVNGLGVAKGLALAWGVPLLGVHHMQAHSLTPRLVSSLNLEASKRHDPSQEARFPYLSFLVSGGHTMLVHSRSLCDHRVLATAHNIAIGDLLDKCARALLPQGYIEEAEAAAGRSLPFGALLESYAGGADGAYDYKYPLARRDEMSAFESPYGWSVNKIAEAFTETDNDAERRLLARATMHQAFEHLASRLLMALKAGAGDDATCLVVSGGVASNQFLRHVLRSALDVHGYGHLAVVAPPPVLCTDNAAMIAWAGMEMYEAGWETDLGVGPIRKWTMDPTADDGGIIGVGGWLQRSEE
ncbi:glycoprotease family protein [Ophiostoma piceae UAMH 11346]|uniref:N(6)-L-threonylcarbamoyladenine synthase n=1 Tax=Ophiostoma piceae (strain UAMH 11346) TaxID=1262450 RepID=S3C0P6_OPHP1|nr:glycoprotease family protein [Ophiostoma piceae UAMH 11346]